MKNFKHEPTLIKIDEFRIFFEEDIMFSYSGKKFYYLRVYALTDWEAILSVRTMFPRFTVRCVVKLINSDWIEIA